jgi:RNA polymerase sigma-70 factor (sigma-E family)
LGCELPEPHAARHATPTAASRSLITCVQTPDRAETLRTVSTFRRGDASNERGDLRARAVNDPSEAFVDFVRQSGASLLRTAVLLTGDVHLGEDLLQSVLASLYRRWTSGQVPDFPEAYVRTALVRGAGRFRLWHRPSAESLTADAPDRIDPLPAADWQLRTELLAALRRLPQRQRAVIALRYFDEFTEAETAGALGCSVGSVKTHAHRGLAKLRLDPVLAAYFQEVVES